MRDVAWRHRVDDRDVDPQHTCPGVDDHVHPHLGPGDDAHLGASHLASVEEHLRDALHQHVVADDDALHVAAAQAVLGGEPLLPALAELVRHLIGPRPELEVCGEGSKGKLVKGRRGSATLVSINLDWWVEGRNFA